MKLAILLRGIAFSGSYVTSGGLTQTVDWKLTRRNILTNIIEAFPDSDVYLTSYRSIEDQLVIDFYNAKGYVFHSLSDSGRSEMDCLIDGLNLILQSKIHYDGVLVSRFDLHFYQSLNQIGINFAKINFLYKEYCKELHEIQGKSSNGVWYINSRNIQSFLEACMDINLLDAKACERLRVNFNNQMHDVNLNQRTHYIHLSLRKKVAPDEIYFLKSGYFASSGSRLFCPFYKIIRDSEDVPECSDPLLVTLGHIFYSLRSNLELNLEQMANKLDLSPIQLRRIESGESAISLLEFIELCNKLNFESSKMLKWLIEEKPIDTLSFSVKNI